MTKPAMTKRTTKGAALTYSELDTNFQNIEIFDGVSWVSTAPIQQTLSTTIELDMLLSWVSKKMQEETEIQHMAEKHPAVAAAYKNFKKSAEQLKTTIILSKDEQTTN